MAKIKCVAISGDRFAEAVHNHEGWCTTCAEFTHESAEPDAREYECPVCEESTVYGAEEAMMQCFITPTEE